MIRFFFFTHQYEDYLNAIKNSNLPNNKNNTNDKLESFSIVLDKYLLTYGFVF